MVSGSPRVRPSATLTGSMSPIRSPTLVSGVATLPPLRAPRVPPATRRLVAELPRQPAAPAADRGDRMVVDLAAGDHRRPLVEQAGQGADQPGLALAALAEQDNVVTGDQRPLQVREYGIAESEDAGKRIAAGPQPGQQVLPYLVLDAPDLMIAGA